MSPERGGEELTKVGGGEGRLDLSKILDGWKFFFSLCFVTYIGIRQVNDRSRIGRNIGISLNETYGWTPPP